LKLSLSILKAIFPGEPGLAGFIAAKNNGSGGDYIWIYNMQSSSEIINPDCK